MGKYVCSICGYVYDETTGTPFADLPQDWVCPLCKAGKSAFALQQPAPAPVAIDTDDLSLDKTPLSLLEKSILCSNLARGCEKQYLAEESALFTQLADYFKSQSPLPDLGDMDTLNLMISEDLEKHIPLAMAVTAQEGDRGALRALTWCQKVSTLLQSLSSQYGGAPLEDTGVFVCSICGFVYVGDQLPDLCPVCKVPNYKFDEITGGRTL